MRYSERVLFSRFFSCRKLRNVQEWSMMLNRVQYSIDQHVPNMQFGTMRVVTWIEPSADHIACQDGLTGSAWGDWSLYTASPLRAGRESKVARSFFGGETTSYASFDPAKELGVQEPIGFWDPLGLSADKDEATFKRRRAVEIKHGRIVTFPVWFEVLSLLKL